MVAAVAVALFETGDLILPALWVAAVSLITAVLFVRKTKSESLAAVVFLLTGLSFSGLCADCEATFLQPQFRQTALQHQQFLSADSSSTPWQI
jgi:hypothetical protein|tara:strand:- start:1508 stop:1786 length:279 start_codon:yes stop_codon:yes gene_type:complete